MDECLSVNRIALDDRDGTISSRGTPIQFADPARADSVFAGSKLHLLIFGARVNSSRCSCLPQGDFL